MECPLRPVHGVLVAVAKRDYHDARSAPGGRSSQIPPGQWELSQADPGVPVIIL